LRSFRLTSHRKSEARRADIMGLGPAASAVDATKIKCAITLGDFLFKDGKYADASRAYQKGWDLDPSSPERLDRPA
jgi:hypothetical protein